MRTKAKFVHDFVRIKRFGNRCKMVYFNTPVRTAGVEDEKRGEGRSPESGERIACNVSRARSRVFELAACNEWEWFVTFTLDPEKYDRYNLSRFRGDLSQWIRNQRRLHGGTLRYLLIPEQHKDGAWHMHGLFAGVPESEVRLFDLAENIPEKLRKTIRSGTPVYDFPRYRDKFGYVTMTRVRDADKCASYITKYITKDIGDGVANGGHLFYASRGLAGAELVYEGALANASAMHWDFEGDYCKIMWSDNPDFPELEV